MGFGGNVAFVRERAVMQQKELANKLTITPRKLFDYERVISNPKDFMKIEIAKALDISMDYLMGLNQEIVSFDRKDVVVLPKGLSRESVAKIKDYVALIARSEEL